MSKPERGTLGSVFKPFLIILALLTLLGFLLSGFQYIQSAVTVSAYDNLFNESELDEESYTDTTAEATTISDTLLPVSSALQSTLDKLYEFAFAQGSQFFSDITASSVEKCPSIPPRLVGPIAVYHEQYPWGELNSAKFHYVKAGGHYEPQYCTARQKVAIIIPYRNRAEHLAVMLLNLHPFLQKQQLYYTIFVVNQIVGSKFNRGTLMNIGFMEAAKQDTFDCFIFHDVDLLPEDDRNVYTCPDDNPRHMSVAVDKFNYKLPYKTILGGITALRWEQFLLINGYSNRFFGWGGEDDDLSFRVRKYFTITRYPGEVARYQMIKHQTDQGNEPNPKRFDQLKHWQARNSKDGLNNLVYTVKGIEKKPLYTIFNIELNQRNVLNAQPHAITNFPYKLSENLKVKMRNAGLYS